MREKSLKKWWHRTFHGHFVFFFVYNFWWFTMWFDVEVSFFFCFTKILILHPFNDSFQNLLFLYLFLSFFPSSPFLRLFIEQIIRFFICLDVSSIHCFWCFHSFFFLFSFFFLTKPVFVFIYFYCPVTAKQFEQTPITIFLISFFFNLWNGISIVSVYDIHLIISYWFTNCDLLCYFSNLFFCFVFILQCFIWFFF